MIQYENVLEYVMDRFKDQPKKVVQIELSKILKISEAGVFNKISGRTQFSTTELLTIAGYYGISLDKFAAQSTKRPAPISFYSQGMEASSNPFDYIYKIERFVGLIDRSEQNIYNITHLCTQPHIFLYLSFPHLLYFKFLTYNWVNWQNPKYNKWTEEYEEVLDKISLNIERLKGYYFKYDSIEIYNIEFVAKLIDQIDFFLKNSLISKEISLKLYKELHELVQMLDRFSNNGSKTYEQQSSSFDLYINSITKISNLAIIHGTWSKYMTLQVDVPDVIMTQDQDYINHMQRWVNKTKSSSTHITGAGALDRHNFFEVLYKKIEEKG